MLFLGVFEQSLIFLLDKFKTLNILFEQTHKSIEIFQKTEVIVVEIKREFDLVGIFVTLVSILFSGNVYEY